ncbi:MAG TPA: DUF998 domain-containing protein [Euzebyales bacterium]|nr:DUF998 domain-containing protein [Euzebyales bacterium]
MSTASDVQGFDRAAAVTRALLGWGVVVGVFYLVVGLGQALVRDGFDLARHQLSLLTLGDFGWVQTANPILSGLMVLATAVGFARALRGTRTAGWAAELLGVFGVCLIASGVFPPDPMAGFPDAATPTEATVSGVLHLAFGAIGFLCLAAAAFVVATWFDRRQAHAFARTSRIAGAVVALGFVGGAALSTQVLGVACLWVAVVVGFAWLAAASVQVYRTVPHPDAHRRTRTPRAA